MTSILGFGIIDPKKFFTTFRAKRPEMLARGVTMAIWPLVESLIKERILNLGFFK